MGEASPAERRVSDARQLASVAVVVLSLGGASCLALDPTPSNSAAPARPATAAGPAHWAYASHLDPVTAKAVIDACVTSANALSVPSSSGRSAGKLCVEREAGAAADVWIELQGAPTIECSSSQPCRISVRYGDGRATAVPAERGFPAAWVLHLENPGRAIKALKANPRARFSLPIDRPGVQVIDFQTDGLRWPPPAGKIVQEP